jgi:hypothetical protein
MLTVIPAASCVHVTRHVFLIPAFYKSSENVYLFVHAVEWLTNSSWVIHNNIHVNAKQWRSLYIFNPVIFNDCQHMSRILTENILLCSINSWYYINTVNKTILYYKHCMFQSQRVIIRPENIKTQKGCQLQICNSYLYERDVLANPLLTICATVLKFSPNEFYIIYNVKTSCTYSSVL